MAQDDTRFRQLMTQSYVPTSEGPPEDFFEEFRTRRFSRGTVAEGFHENSKLTPINKHEFEKSSGLFMNDPQVKFAIKESKPDYRGYDYVSLPEPEEEPVDASLFEGLRGRRTRRDFAADETISVQTLSNLLHHAVGVSGVREGNTLRKYPSAGGLYPVELYFHLSAEVGDLTPGLYYYVPDDHAVRRLKEDVTDETVQGLFADGQSVDYVTPELNVFLTASFWRSAAKYGPRGYRYILQESGHLCQNLQLVASALGLGSVPRGSFFDTRTNEFLEIDGVNEAAIYAITIGSLNGVSTTA